jgi:hypothetical protein
MADLQYSEPGVAEVDAPELPEMAENVKLLLWETRAMKMALIAAFNLNANDFVAENFSEIESSI